MGIIIFIIFLVVFFVCILCSKTEDTPAEPSKPSKSKAQVQAEYDAALRNAEYLIHLGQIKEQAEKDGDTELVQAILDMRYEELMSERAKQNQDAHASQ